MKQRLGLVAIVVLVVVGGWLVWDALQTDEEVLVSAQIVDPDALALPVVGFRTVAGGYQWSFPDDLGPHPDFQREQWILTTTDECAIQIDVRFERLSLLPAQLMPPRESEWSTQSTFTAQAILRRSGDTLLNEALTTRAALDLAGADADQVWVEDWVLDFAENVLAISSNDVTLTGTLIFADPRDLSNDEAWYSYEHPAELRSQLVADENTAFTCDVVLMHRFGSTP